MKPNPRIRIASALITAAVALIVLLVLLASASIAGAAETQAASPASGAAVAEAADAEAAKDAKSAAERRAAGSEFERTKLDPKAFEAEEGQASKGSSKQPSKGGSVGRMFFGLVVVLGVIFGVNYLLKKWGQSRLQGASGTAGVIDVVATTSLAQNRSLHLVRVGGELVLIGATEQSITQLGTVSGADFTSDAGNRGKGEFQAMLNGSMVGSQPGVPQGMGGAGSAKPSLINRVLGNLQMLTAR